MEFTSLFNLLTAIFTVFAQVIILLLVLALLMKDKKILNFFSRNALLFSFLIAFMASAGSLIYSEFIGYEPCKLCWLQRIFVYPQAIILGMAFFKKDISIAIYSLVLSVIGAILAGYHYLLQIGIVPDVSCGVVGQSISCAQRLVMQFGYITIPMMSFTIFLLLAILMSFILKKKQ